MLAVVTALSRLHDKTTFYISENNTWAHRNTNTQEKTLTALENKKNREINTESFSFCVEKGYERKRGFLL